MIIEGIDKFPMCETKVVSLWPTSKDEAEGELGAGGRTYVVKVTYDEGSRVWVRVKVASDIDDEDSIQPAALEVARRGLEDPAWAPLVIDPRDGETIYTATFTCDLSADAVDRFLTQAKNFLDENGDEVARIIAGDDGSGPQGIDSLFSGLFGSED